ncbi:MAG: hypothetical protein Q605_AUC01056G0001, partial [Actinomyces urogenitalis DORA_12]
MGSEGGSDGVLLTRPLWLGRTASVRHCC